MTDCANAEIRDLLPDYVNHTLAVVDVAIVESHVQGCADCTDEIALLRAAVAARPSAATIDIQKIVAALPKVLSAAGANVRAISSAPSVVRKTGGFRQWQAVAAAAIIAVGGISVVVARRNATPLNSAVVQRDTLDPNTATAVVASIPPLAVETAVTVRPTTSAKNVALSVGELNDFSDDELEAVLARLNSWDGATAAEPPPGVPLLPRTPGGVR